MKHLMPGKATKRKNSRKGVKGTERMKLMVVNRMDCPFSRRKSSMITKYQLSITFTDVREKPSRI